MFFTYIRTNCHGRLAARLYQVGSRDIKTLLLFNRHFAATGSVAPESTDRGRPRPARIPGHEELILLVVGDDPSINTC